MQPYFLLADLNRDNYKDLVVMYAYEPEAAESQGAAGQDTNGQAQSGQALTGQAQSGQAETWWKLWSGIRRKKPSN